MPSLILFQTVLPLLGDMAAAEGGADNAILLGSVENDDKACILAVVEGGPDSADFAGEVLVEGSFALTEGQDEPAFIAHAGAYGDLSASEAGADVLSFDSSNDGFIDTPPFTGTVMVRRQRTIYLEEKTAPPAAVAEVPSISSLAPNGVADMKSKKAAQAKTAKVMHEWKEGTLHSGSKTGPVVKSQKQAVAIAMSEAGLTKKNRHTSRRTMG